MVCSSCKSWAGDRNKYNTNPSSFRVSCMRRWDKENGYRFDVHCFSCTGAFVVFRVFVHDRRTTVIGFIVDGWRPGWREVRAVTDCGHCRVADVAEDEHLVVHPRYRVPLWWVEQVQVLEISETWNRLRTLHSTGTSQQNTLHFTLRSSLAAIRKNHRIHSLSLLFPPLLSYHLLSFVHFSHLLLQWLFPFSAPRP